MRIWVDADACPNPIKEILFRVAARTGLEMVLVANHPIRVPRAPNVRLLQVAHGFDGADKRIVADLAPDDLVITADIPLAAAVVDKGATGLNPRGELYTPENVKDRLAMRNLMDELRGGGLVSGGPKPLDAKDRQAFANALDRWVAKHAPRPAS
jgi:uncharacterized protein YaiI (UPF0178 family)